MAFKKDTKIKSNFTKITISLASPEEILTSLSAMVCSVREFSVLQRITNALAESTSA